MDRRVEKNATRDAARENGVEVRRLPIKEHAPPPAKGARTRVLNVDAALHCLLRFRDNGGDWADAFAAALPDGRATPHRVARTLAAKRRRQG